MLDWDEVRNSQHRRLCSSALTFVRIAEQTILSQVKADTTQAQYEAAQQLLRNICERFESQLTLFHYATTSGVHTCVRDVFTDMSSRLTGLCLMNQTAAATPPAPKQQLITIEGIVVEREEELRTSREETDLGTEDNPFDNWHNQ